MQNVQFVFLASLPSLPLCFQPRSRPFVARAWMRKDYGLFCSLKDRSTDRQTWRTLKRIAIVVRKLVSLTIFQRSFLLIDAMLQRHILFDLSYSSNFSSYKPRSQVLLSRSSWGTMSRRGLWEQGWFDQSTFRLGTEALLRRINQKKSSWGSAMNNTFLFFYSLKNYPGYHKFFLACDEELRWSQADTSSGHFFRLNQDRKPRTKSRWHPGYPSLVARSEF